MSDLLKTWPQKIYLQLDEDSVDDGVCEATWCQDKINDGDVEYIRADVYKEALSAFDALGK